MFHIVTSIKAHKIVAMRHYILFNSIKDPRFYELRCISNEAHASTSLAETETRDTPYKCLPYCTLKNQVQIRRNIFFLQDYSLWIIVLHA